jgi:hypothetical protein
LTTLYSRPDGVLLKPASESKAATTGLTAPASAASAMPDRTARRETRVAARGGAAMESRAHGARAGALGSTDGRPANAGIAGVS